MNSTAARLSTSRETMISETLDRAQMHEKATKVDAHRAEQPRIVIVGGGGVRRGSGRASAARV